MAAYTVVTGDTFAIVSRKQYGVETQASNIAAANPGFTEPLQVGTVLIIPPEIGAPSNQPQTAPAANPNEIAIAINGERFRFWESVSLFSAIDTLATFSFSAPFDFNNIEFRNQFKPFQYDDVEITVGGDPQMRGVMLNVTPVVSPERSTVDVSGYSLPGSLQDCVAPPSAYPVQFEGFDLWQIAFSLAEPFGVTVEIEGNDAGPVFDMVAINPTEKVLSFLAKLAAQRNFVISSTRDGKLLFRKSIKPGNPVAKLFDTSSPLISIVPAFKPQQYYSHISALEPVSVGSVGSSWVVQNGRLRNKLRPIVFKAADTETADIESVALVKAGRMFANSVAYTMELSTWRNEQDGDNLWRENTTLTVFDPKAMIYNDFEFLIRSVTLDKTQDKERATLELVIPGAFDGVIPEVMPWDG